MLIYLYKKIYKPKEFRELVNRSVSTLQRWDRESSEIEIVNNEDLSPQEEMIQDLISIIHIFSCHIYGLRKYKKQIKEDKDV